MIIIELPRPRTPFSELKEGDVFNFDGEWYLKMMPCETKMMRINAVCLTDGMLAYIKPESVVEYRNVALEVEEV